MGEGVKFGLISNVRHVEPEVTGVSEDVQQSALPRMPHSEMDLDVVVLDPSKQKRDPEKRAK